jgi:hypothetical protein
MGLHVSYPKSLGQECLGLPVSGNHCFIDAEIPAQPIVSARRFSCAEPAIR